MRSSGQVPQNSAPTWHGACRPSYPLRRCYWVPSAPGIARFGTPPNRSADPPDSRSAEARDTWHSGRRSSARPVTKVRETGASLLNLDDAPHGARVEGLGNLTPNDLRETIARHLRCCRPRACCGTPGLGFRLWQHHRDLIRGRAPDGEPARARGGDLWAVGHPDPCRRGGYPGAHDAGHARAAQASQTHRPPT